MVSYLKDEPLRDDKHGVAAAAIAAGLRDRASEGGLTGLVGSRMDPTQRFEDFAGELPSRGEVERWCRAARVKLSNDQKAVIRGPADLLSKGTIEPAQFDKLKKKIMSGARSAAIARDDAAAGALMCAECSPPAMCEHRWRDWDGQSCNIDDCGGQLLLCTRCHTIRCRACGWRSHIDDEVPDAQLSPPATSASHVSI